jgi:PAS domain S-box-containing protein
MRKNLRKLQTTKFWQMRSLPALAGLGVWIATLWLAQALVDRDRAQILRKVESTATDVSQEVMGQMQNRILALERMAERWERQGGSPQAEWQVDATNYIRDFPGFQAIEWVDSAYYVRWIVPLAGNQAAQNLNLASEERRRAALEEARQQQAVTVTRTVTLAQKGKGFLVYVPLFFEAGEQGQQSELGTRNSEGRRQKAEGRRERRRYKGINPKSFDGFILGVFRVQSLFDTLLPQHVAPGYAIAIFDGSEEIYRRDRSKSDRQLEKKWSREAKVHFEGVTWRVLVYPTSTLLAEERSLLPAIVLGGGLVIGVLLAGAVRFAQKAQGHARSVKAINQQLTRERAKIQEATMLQRAILDSANYTIISTTVDGTITTFNTAAERWLGYTAAEVVGKTTPVIIHDEDEVRQRAQELSQELGVALEPRFEVFVAKAQLGEPDEREWTYIRKDGSRFPVLLSVTALRDAEGNVTGFLGIGSDISDRKRAEAALHESESTLRSFFDSAPMMMGIVELVGDDILHISDNATAAQFFGMAPEAMRNRRSSEMGTPQEQICRWIGHYRESQQTGKPVRFEYAHATETETRWLSATVSPIASVGGERFSYVVDDITERKQAQEELLWKETLLRSMASASPLAFFVVDNRTDDILYFNRRFCEIWGIEHLEARMQRGELKNKDIIPDCVPMLADVAAFAKSCKPLQSEENRIVIEDEIPFIDGRTIRRFSTPIRDEQDRYFGRLYIFEDISDRKHREEILRNITLGVSAETGEAFFQSLVQYLTRALEVEYAFVGELVEPEGISIRTIAGYSNGRAIENFEYALANAPCEQVVGQQLRVYPRDVQQQFPLDAYLREIEAQSYLGAPLFDSTGRPLGLIAVLSCKPLDDTQLMEEILTIFAVRASSEIERRRSEAELQRRNLRSQLLDELTLKIRRSLRLEKTLQTTVTEVRRFLETDRVLLFQLHADGSGTVVQEAVIPGFPVTLGQDILDPCFQEGYIERYRQGRVSAIADIERADIQPCHVEFLQQFAVKANLVVPILQKEELWGLLIAHQCASPRQWTSFETELLRQLADRVGIALAQSELLEAVRESEARFRTMADSAPVLLWMSGLDKQRTFFNQSWLEFTGRTLEQELGNGWGAGVHPEDLQHCLDTYTTAFDARESFQMEYRLRRADGEYRWILDTGKPRYTPDGNFVGYIGSCVDISDRREVEQLKDEFVSIVSHELRTPLTSILGALDLLAGGALSNRPEQFQHMLQIAAKNADRLVRLINDILDIERIESGKVTMTKQACDAANLMTAAAEVMQSMASAAEVTLSVSPVSARLWADPDRIVQVLTNLLSNAIKFSPPGSTVWLTAEAREKEPSYILFRVRDQGRGIPADKIETIFGRFQQVDASDSRQKGGTGLGLAVCRSIVQHHEGQIWAESGLGEGSTFYFTLPLAQEEEIKASTHPSGPLVLVCDDDASVRSVVRMVLEHQDYRVITAASGQEAVKLAAQERPDIILLNLMMPGMNGWETLAALKEQQETKNLPVIILSGLFPDARKSTPEVSDWIVKPPDERSLLQALERILTDPNRKVKVLIVEDDADLAQILIAMFDRHGIETYHAQTGREAIQLSQQIFPDLLVLDLVLPGCDGFAVVDWLRQHNRLCRVPLVVYTSKDLDDSERERLKLGQTLFLTKGRITPEQFEQRIIKLLGRIIRRRKGDDNRESQAHFGR